jgi:L-amino acid N-acyltransferase YncA
MAYTIVPLNDEHADAALAVFNEYVPNSFGAYLDAPLSAEGFSALRKSCLAELVVLDGKSVTGFGLLRPYHPASTFKRTGEVSYFISSGHTHRGLGTELLEELIRAAHNKAIDHLLASVCSLNPESLAFHHKHEFTQCGVFRNVGKKNGRDFSVVWFEKKI